MADAASRFNRADLIWIFWATMYLFTHVTDFQTKLQTI